MSFKKYLPILTLLLIVYVVYSMLTWSLSMGKDHSPGFVPFNENWMVSYGNTQTTHETLPLYISAPGTETVVFSKVLDETIKESDSIGFFTAFMSVRVYLDDTNIYRLEPPEGSGSRTPGKAWNFIPLNQAEAGNIIRIELENNYYSNILTIPDIFVGSSGDMTLSFIVDETPAMILTFIQLIVALACISYWILVQKESISVPFVRLLMFAAVTTFVWSFLETQIPVLLFGHPLILNQLSFLSLKLMQISVMMYFAELYKVEHLKFIRIFTVLLIIDFVVTLLLQAFGIADFMQTSYFGTIIAIAPSMYYLYITYRLIRTSRYQEAKIRKVIHVNAFLLVTAFVFIILNTIHSYAPNIIDGAFYSRIGFTIYLIGTAFLYMSDSLQLIQQGRNADDIRELAETDIMTKLRNRNAFMIDIKEIPTEAFPHYGIVMCDLNNLKEINDVYGHSMGDYYIQVGAETIRDAYTPYGTVYRIGGDEFCAIVRDLEVEEAEKIRMSIRDKKIQLGGDLAQLTFDMGIAVGYERFDSNRDTTLMDVTQRADATMYENKKTMKHRGSPM